jgi:hypothetical protein
MILKESRGQVNEIEDGIAQNNVRDEETAKGLQVNLTNASPLFYL